MNIFHAFIWLHYLDVWLFWDCGFWGIVWLFWYAAKLGDSNHILISLYDWLAFFFWFLWVINHFFDVFAVLAMFDLAAFLENYIFGWNVREARLSCTNRFVWSISSLNCTLKKSYLIYFIFIKIKWILVFFHL